MAKWKSKSELQLIERKQWTEKVRKMSQTEVKVQAKKKKKFLYRYRKGEH